MKIIKKYLLFDQYLNGLISHKDFAIQIPDTKSARYSDVSRSGLNLLTSLRFRCHEKMVFLNKNLFHFEARIFSCCDVSLSNFLDSLPNFLDSLSNFLDPVSKRAFFGGDTQSSSTLTADLLWDRHLRGRRGLAGILT